MKKVTIFLIIFLFAKLSFGQSSLDSLRLVMPVGNSGSVKSANFSSDSKIVYTISGNSVKIWGVNSGFLLNTIVGHSNEIESAVLSSDNKMLLTSSRDSTAKLWDVFSGKLIRTFKGHFGFVTSAIFSNNNEYILTSSSWDHKALLWDLNTGKLLRTFGDANVRVYSASFSLDDNRILTSGYPVCIWGTESGKLIHSFNAINQNQNVAIFSPDNDKILTTSTCNNDVHIWDSKSWNLLQTFKGNKNEMLNTWEDCGKGINNAIFSSNNEFLLIQSNESSKLWDLKLEKEIKISRKTLIDSHSGFIGSDNNRILVFGYNKALLFDILNDKVLLEFEGTKGWVEGSISSDNRFILTTSNDTNVYLWNANTGKLLHILNGYSKPINSACFSSDEHSLYTTSNDYNVQVFDVFFGKYRNSLSGHNNKITSVSFSSDSDKILTSSFDGTARVWESKSLELLYILKGHKGWIQSASFSNDNNLIVTTTGGLLSDKVSKIWSVNSGELIYTLAGHNSWINSAVFSSDSRNIITGSADNTARIWNTETGKVKFELNGHTAGVVYAEFSNDNNLVLTSSDDFTIKIWNAHSGECVRTINGISSQIIKSIFSRDHKEVLTSTINGLSQLWNTVTGDLIFEFKANSFDFTPDNNYIIASLADNSIILLEKMSGTVVKFFRGHNEKIISIDITKDGRNILSVAQDQKIILWDVATGNPIYERIQLENNNWLVKLPNSPYYMCSKDASKMLHYVTPSLKVIGFEQLDPVYNRPDIVLDSIWKYFGNEDRGTIEEYRKSWEKRIDRLGLDKEKLGKGEISVPNAEIVGADEIAYESKDGKLEINVSANDPKYPLRRFNVYVNEVPLYGSAGISIAHLKKQVWDTTVSVPLSMGENKIQVSVMNELGLENFKYPTYVNFSPQNELVSKTFFIGIGVNEFLEQEHNLKYCVKDVQDLAMAFAVGKSNVDTLLLTNKEVTRENVLKLKEFLSKTSVNDKVIISCSSHGLLDDSLNFYLAMHDVDFKNPKARGLKYEELESLLDGIPSRQKLLLLDACNSGENDKTEVLKKELEQKQVKMNTDEVLAARGAIIKLEEENKSNFKKMNELFVNVRNNTGSVIISAAGGQESALEAIKVDGEAIENGAFTFSVLEYLISNKTNSEALTVNKLKQYTEKRVEEITKGKQRPTSRQETMEVDWRVSN